VALRTKGKGDRLLIARGTPGATLQETVAGVMARAGGRPEPMEAGDRFQMPKLDFDVTRNYHELVGKSFANEGFTGYVITRAAQNVRFRLDQNGAILKSDAVIEAKSAAPAGRRMVCDGPFLVLLARAGQPMPYFALWVANDELLVRAGGTTATGAK
jgi:hypothetical protein